MEVPPVPTMDADHPDLFIPEPVQLFLPHFRRLVKDKVKQWLGHCHHGNISLYTCSIKMHRPTLYMSNHMYGTLDREEERKKRIEESTCTCEK